MMYFNEDDCPNDIYFNIDELLRFAIYLTKNFISLDINLISKIPPLMLHYSSLSNIQKDIIDPILIKL